MNSHSVESGVPLTQLEEAIKQAARPVFSARHPGWSAGLWENRRLAGPFAYARMPSR